MHGWTLITAVLHVPHQKGKHRIDVHGSAFRCLRHLTNLPAMLSLRRRPRSEYANGSACAVTEYETMGRDVQWQTFCEP